MVSKLLLIESRKRNKSMDNNKLIEIAEEQIKELKKMQEKCSSVEESIKWNRKVKR